MPGTAVPGMSGLYFLLLLLGQFFRPLDVLDESLGAFAQAFDKLLKPGSSLHSNVPWRIPEGHRLMVVPDKFGDAVFVQHLLATGLPRCDCPHFSHFGIAEFPPGLHSDSAFAPVAIISLLEVVLLVEQGTEPHRYADSGLSEALVKVGDNLVEFFGLTLQFGGKGREVLHCGVSPSAGSFPVARVGRDHTISVVSWRALLVTVMTRLQMSGDHATAGDVGQLLGLCERMDEDAFLPLTSEDIGENIGRRVWDLAGLVESVIEQAGQENLCVLKGGKFSGGRGYYGRLVCVGKRWYGIYFSAWTWKTFGRSPIWFQGSTYDSANYQSIRDALAGLATMVPPRLYLHDEQPFVPLLLKRGVERDEVVKYLLEQLREIVGLLRKGIPDSGSDQPPPPEDAPSEDPAPTPSAPAQG